MNAHIVDLVAQMNVCRLCMAAAGKMSPFFRGRRVFQPAGDVLPDHRSQHVHDRYP